MSKKRKQHSAEFKAMIGMEALKGIKTINEIAREYSIHPVQVGQWKKELKDRLPEVFKTKSNIEFKCRSVFDRCRSHGISLLQTIYI